MRSEQKTNQKWGLALGSVGLLVVVIGLWTAFRVNRPTAQHDSASGQAAAILKQHPGKPVKVKLAAGRGAFFLPAGEKTVAPALKQAASAVLAEQPQGAKQKMVIVATEKSQASLGLVTLTTHFDSLYTLGHHEHHQRLQRQLTVTKAGKLAKIGDIVADDNARRAVNYAAQTHQAETTRLDEAQLSALIQQPLLHSLEATNFTLTKAGMTIRTADGKPSASVPYHKLAPYLKGATPQPPSGKLIALTFDDGPNPKTTPAILKILADAKVKATFFELGSGIAEFPVVAKSVKAAGHEVGTHTYDHPFLPKLSAAQTLDEIYGKNLWTYYHVFGTLPPFIRPPFGAMSKANGDLVGMPAIQWSVDSQDWKSKSKPAIIARVQATAQPGGIVLMHDIQPAEVEALPVVIANLKNQGYQFVTVSQLLGQRLMPGHQYFGQGDERPLS
ncbi:polysaccharide deacetylase family protein [Lacticaseibacillus hegangensis]|uniref:Polysaccharide deacetylase family protein n=1 Tax=Lacticaseibacillus hegangensis TaxID=2486010 RepID=A0ABW4CUS9_9LACO|nr:polysaccharide deacetylase family protein [Lacticaseibacillus hegangensis]